MEKELKIEYVDINSIKPYENNARNNEEAIPYVMKSIEKFGFNNPIILDKNNVIVCGHTRYESAKRLKYKEIPCIYAEDLNEEQIKAFRLADNKVAEKSDWNYNKLQNELEKILNIDMTEYGFLHAGIEWEDENSIKDTEIEEKENKETMFYECPSCHNHILKEEIICK